MKNHDFHSIYPLKISYFRENSDYVSVVKEGAIVFEFIERKTKEKKASNLVNFRDFHLFKGERINKS